MTEETLTEIEAMRYLHSLASGKGEDMPGTIRTKEKCPVCKKPFEHIKKHGLICMKHKTVPKKFFVDVYTAKGRAKIYSHKSGKVLDSYSLAEETLKHIQYQIRQRTFDPSKYVKSDIKKFLFPNLYKQWLAIKKIEGMATLYKYEQFERDYFPWFADMDVRDIRTATIHTFYHQLKKTLSGKSKKNILACLHAFCTWLLNMEQIEKLPSFPEVALEQTEWKWVDVDVQAKILLAIPEADRDLYLFLALHGCRPSEGRALKVKDIDFKGSAITIRRNYSGRSGTELVEHTKTKKCRTFPINEELAARLQRLCKNKLPDAFVFVNPRTGKPYAKTTYQELWDAARKAVGVDIKAYEGLRHSWASQRVSRGVDIYLISKVLGHTDIRTTQRYSHTNLEALKGIMSVPKPSPKKIAGAKS